MTGLTSSYNAGSNLFDDPALPNIATVMDVDRMAEHFTRLFRASGLAVEWEVAQCGIEKVYYRPGKHCGVLYRLTLRHSSGKEIDEWIFGRTVPHGTEDERFAAAVVGLKHFQAARDLLKFMPAISFWGDLNMILWLFPLDPKLETLPQVIDPAFVRQQVEANLPLFGVSESGPAAKPAAWSCGEIRYDRVKYMPGKRCVLRYHVNLISPSGTSHEKTFYCKIYQDERSRYHFDIVQSAYQQLTAQTDAVNIPRPLLHFDGLHTYWQAEWPGNAVIEVMDKYDWQELFPRIANVLATFHRHPANGFDTAPNLDAVLATADEDVAKLVSRLPHQQHFAAGVLERLKVVKRTVLEKQEIPQVPIHGAWRLEQMLVRDHELALVDFDAVSIGDPLYDLAEFVASLQFLELSRGWPRERLAAAAETLCRSYAEQVPWPCDRRRVAWYALAFLMTKFYSTTKNLDRRALQQLDLAGKKICADWLKILGTV
ncbi:MAG: aminoglycoside phosphotransferase family protein [bacterium]